MGTHGNTHKEMDQENGASIKLRGRGSHKLSKRPEPSNKEEHHVLVEAYNKNSLEKACRMVEKLLVPVNELHLLVNKIVMMLL